jgi:hypothetical protein
VLALADAVAVLHGAAVLFMLTGALLALRWPRLLWLHVPVALAILAVNAAGRPCPLTVGELGLRAAAGAAGYPDGFIGHYLLAPLEVDVHTTGAQVAIYTVGLTPNIVGYALLLSRRLRSRGALTG